MSKQAIGLDMDGVILDHSHTVAELLKQNGVSVQAQDTAFSRLPGIVDDTTLEYIFDTMYGSPNGSKNSVLMEGALECIETLIKNGHDVHIISRRNNPKIAKVTLKRLGIWPDLFNTHNTHFVARTHQKIELARQLGITDYVDDQPSVLTGSMMPIAHKVLFDQFNILPDNDDYIRITSWKELGRFLA